MKRCLLLLICIISFFSWVSAQKNCGTMDVLDKQLQENPELFKNMEEIESQIRDYVKKHAVSGQRYTITIPTVVHVLYRTSTENITDAQIQTQIDVLNEDFSATNADLNLVPPLFQPVVSDIEVQFCLAQQTPAGAATTGITRKSTTKTSWGTNDDVKKSSKGGTDPWNPSQYLNIWVCNIGGGILGYAQFPGGSAATDGVVLDYRYTGTIGTATAPFNKGRTATHEVGHWLNLRHIWGDATCGNDFVSDTPVHNTSNGGCPVHPHYSTCSGSPVEMTMNYMDYTNDACMYMFSAGQKARMRGVLEGSGVRSSLQNSPGCDPVNPSVCTAPSGLAASYITSNSATLSWSSVSNANNYTLEYKLASASTWTSQTVTGTSSNASSLSPATSYQARVRSNCNSGPGNFSATITFSTLSNSNCTDVYESNNSRTAAKTIVLQSDITAKISSSSDVDWFKFNNTSSQRNIRVSLTNLPADYDMMLYRSSNQVAISQNDGTNDEEIIYNNTRPATTYYVQVYGYNGVFNNSLCYNLFAEINGSNFKSLNGDEEADWVAVEDEFLVFPNPTSGEVTMMIPFGKLMKGVIHIHDMSGKQIYAQEVEGNQTTKTYQLDVSGFRAGMYLISFQSGQQYFQQKLSVIK